MPPAMSAAIAGEGMGEEWCAAAVVSSEPCVKRDELRRLGEGLARLPFGDRAVGHAQLLRKFLLRHARAAAQTV